MAQATKGAAKNGESGERKGPPEGFRRRAAVSEAPWFKNKEGNVAHGKLLGRYMMNQTPPRPYYQVELYADAAVTIGRGDDAEETVAKKGDVINLGEAFKLKCLKDVEIPEIIAGGEYDIWYEVEKKIKISGGKTMWVADVQTKLTKPPVKAVVALPPDEGVAEGEEAEGGAPF